MDTRLPFAKEIATGKVVSVDEVDGGAACGCVCLFCGATMQAKKGAINVHHFAHMPRAINEEDVCPASFERCVFWMTRRILAEGTQLRTPQYERVFGYRPERQLKITEEKCLPYSQVSFPYPSSAQVGEDTVLVVVAKHTLALKIFIKGGMRSRFVGPFETAAGKVATIAIDLGDIRKWFKQSSRTFRQELEEALLDGVTAKQWIYHPREASIKSPAAHSPVSYGRRATSSASATTYVTEPLAGAVRRCAKSGRIIKQ